MKYRVIMPVTHEDKTFKVKRVVTDKDIPTHAELALCGALEPIDKDARAAVDALRARHAAPGGGSKV